MQKGYYYSREHTFVRAGSSGEDSDPLSAASHDVAESLKGIFSAPVWAILCIGRSGKGADSTITYSHKWCMVRNPAIYGMELGGSSVHRGWWPSQSRIGMCFAKRVSKPVVRTGARPLRCL